MSLDRIPHQRPQTPLLDTVESPTDLRGLSLTQLQTLVDELRAYLVWSAGQSGGHFGANLGVVELTVALHTLLNTPHDRLVWDVGHQAYVHKVLTGRRDRLPTIRSQGGLAAFPARSESEFDTFGVGHSSTSISAALGMALAARYQGQPRRTVAVIGDGALSAGMAFEGLLDAAYQDADLMVILNDNDMSISASTGGLARHLASVWQGDQVISVDAQGQPVMQPRPNLPFSARTHDGVALPPSNLFEALGFEYFGPFDGHDLPELLRVLGHLKDRKGPRLVHVYTQKGKGFTPAEADPIRFHAVSKLSIEPAKPHVVSSSAVQPQKYSDVFGQFLCDLAAQDDRMLAITPAMCEGSGMGQFAREYPDRFFDVAIAEQHAVTLAAGMACEGVKPIVAIYSTFLQRAYDQLIHDVALQNLDVTFAIDRAGLVGEDGPTHAGVFDYAFLRTVPNMVVMAPKDEAECRQMLYTAYEHEGPAAVRYPRGTGPGSVIESEFLALPLGQAEVLSYSADPNAVALLAFGSLVGAAEQAAEHLKADGVPVTVINMRFIKPLDHRLLQKIVATHRALVTIEEHMLAGGAGSAVGEWQTDALAKHQVAATIPLLSLGLSDQFSDQGNHQQLLAEAGLDASGIARAVRDWLPVIMPPLAAQRPIMARAIEA